MPSRKRWRRSIETRRHSIEAPLVVFDGHPAKAAHLTAERVPNDPAVPDVQEIRRLPVTRHLPPWYGAIGAGCSNST